MICDKPYEGFQYTYNKCTKRILGKCVKSELVAYEVRVVFEDKELYKEFCHKNFIFKVRDIPVDI